MHVPRHGLGGLGEEGSPKSARDLRWLNHAPGPCDTVAFASLGQTKRAACAEWETTPVRVALDFRKLCAHDACKPRRDCGEIVQGAGARHRRFINALTIISHAARTPIRTGVLVMLDRATARALAEAGYMPLSVYVELMSEEPNLKTGHEANDRLPALTQPVAKQVA